VLKHPAARALLGGQQLVTCVLALQGGSAIFWAIPRRLEATGTIVGSLTPLLLQPLATSRKVAGSRPDEVNEYFQFI
jgi:hypothetical protein